MNTPSKILIATLLAGGAAALALPVVAQNAAPAAPKPPVTQARFGDDHRGGPGMRGGFGPGQLIRQFDTNADGTLSAEEINAKLGAYDANKDGSLSLEEYQGLFTELTNQIMVRTFQFLDRDGDAIVTEAEFSEPLEHAQERMAEADDHGARGGRRGDDHGPRGGGWRPWR